MARVVTAHTLLSKGVTNYPSLAPALLSFAPHTPIQSNGETTAPSVSPEAQGRKGTGTQGVPLRQEATLVLSRPVPSVMPGGHGWINEEEKERTELLPREGTRAAAWGSGMGQCPKLGPLWCCQHNRRTRQESRAGQPPPLRNIPLLFQG